MKQLIIGIISIWNILSVASISAQSKAGKMQEIQEVIRTEEELFIAIDRIRPEDSKACLEENSISNQVQFTGDSAFVNYINYTELFCEAYVLRTQYTFQFDLQDIDLAMMRLVEKKYDIGNGKLKEGKPGWFEVQLFTKDKKAAILKRDIESKEQEKVSTVSLLVKEKEPARQLLTLLKDVLNEPF
jgi:hypothetical protein